MAQIKSDERIPARMPSEVYEKIVEAARLTGATLNQFLVQAALEKADSVLERERVIRLSRKAADMVFHLLDHPNQPHLSNAQSCNLDQAFVLLVRRK